MIPNSLHLPYLPIKLVFYVDCNTKRLVKPKYETFLKYKSEYIVITTEDFNKTNKDVYLYNPTAIGNWLTTEQEVNQLVSRELLSDKDATISFVFSKYLELCYKYLNLACSIVHVEVSEYEEIYDYYAPYVDESLYEKVVEDNVTYYSAKLPVTNKKSIPSFNNDLASELSDRCLILEANGFTYLYVDKEYCGYQENTSPFRWAFVKNSKILTPELVKDFNILTKEHYASMCRGDIHPSDIEQDESTMMQYLCNLLVVI